MNDYLLYWLTDSFYFYFYWLFHCQMSKYPQYGYTITMWSAKSVIFLFLMGSFFCLLHTCIFLFFQWKTSSVKGYCQLWPNYNFSCNSFDYSTSRCTKSLDSFDAITTIYVDICPSIISVEKKPRQRKKSQHSSFTFLSFLLNLWEERSY